MQTGGRLRIGGKGPNASGGEIVECLNGYCMAHNIKYCDADTKTITLGWKNSGWEKQLEALITTRHRQV